MAEAETGANRRDDWSRPLPEVVPRPTYWPAVMALGIVFVFWGIVTTLIISAVGLTLFVLALAGWIHELRRERREPADG
jgi:hypothetical protein